MRNVTPFRKFLEVAAQCNGQIINYAKIDLIVERPSQTTLAIEIKSATLVDEVEIGKMQRLGNDLENSELVILSRETLPRQVQDVSILPWREGILRIFE